MTQRCKSLPAVLQTSSCPWGKGAATLSRNLTWWKFILSHSTNWRTSPIQPGPLFLIVLTLPMAISVYTAGVNNLFFFSYQLAFSTSSCNGPEVSRMAISWMLLHLHLPRSVSPLIPTPYIIPCQQEVARFEHSCESPPPLFLSSALSENLQ